MRTKLSTSSIRTNKDGRICQLFVKMSFLLWSLLSLVLSHRRQTRVRRGQQLQERLGQEEEQLSNKSGLVIGLSAGLLAPVIAVVKSVWVGFRHDWDFGCDDFFGGECWSCGH